MIAARADAPTHDMQHPQREWRVAIVALIALLGALALPLLVRGRVIHPDDGRGAVGLEPEVAAQNVGDRRLGDASNYYVPEEHLHLQGDASGWIGLWNPHVELGRPASHLASVSPAYLPARILGWCTGDAYWFHTLLALATIAGTALFLFLFLRELELSPWACFAGAAGLACGSFALYWAVFPIFVAGLCWTAAILWLSARWLRQPALVDAAGLAFATHALLLSAYPQQIVWHAWIVGGFVVGRWWRAPERRVATLAGLAACALAGLAASAPVYLDVALQASRSGRPDVDREFFLASLPKFADAREVLRWLASMVDVFLAAEPLDAARERGFNGVSLAPAFAGFVGLAFASGARRRAAGWLAFAALCVVLTAWPAAYLFAVDHLGLSISRFRPQAAALIPLAVAGAIGVDAHLRGKAARPLVPLLLALAPLAFAAAFARADVPASRWIVFALASAGLAAFAVLRWRALVGVLAFASLLFWSAPLLVSIPRDAIASSSPLVDAMRARTADGSRFALAGERQRSFLPPNREALHGLSSVHSYDPLTPDAYRAWCATVSDAGTFGFGRWFQVVSGNAGYARPEFSAAAVGLVVAETELRTDALVATGAIGPWRLYRPARAPLLAAHVLDADAAALARGSVDLGGHVHDRALGRAEIVERRDDLWRVALDVRADTSLLFVSVQHHPHWRAYGAAGESLDTVVVDGTFLGVTVPKGCAEVRLAFEPWARWAWVPQLAFVLAAAFALAVRFAPRRSALPA